MKQRLTDWGHALFPNLLAINQLYL